MERNQSAKMPTTFIKKKNTKTSRQINTNEIITVSNKLIDLTSYDDLIMKTKQYLSKYKKDIKESQLTKSFTGCNSRNSTKTQNKTKTDRGVSVDNILITFSKEEEDSKRSPFQSTNYIEYINKVDKKENYYKTLYEAMKGDLVSVKEKMKTVQKENDKLKESIIMKDNSIKEAMIEKEKILKRLNQTLSQNSDIFEILKDIKQQKNFIEKSMTDLKEEYQSQFEKISRDLEDFENKEKKKKEENDVMKSEVDKMMKENLKIKYDLHVYKIKTGDAENEKKQLEGKVKELNKEIDNLKKVNEDINKKLKALVTDNVHNKRKSEQINQDFIAVSNEKELYKKQIDSLNEKIKELQNKGLEYIKENKKLKENSTLIEQLNKSNNVLKENIKIFHKKNLIKR